jgi:hypothetical protein
MDEMFRSSLSTAPRFCTSSLRYVVAWESQVQLDCRSGRLSEKRRLFFNGGELAREVMFGHHLSEWARLAKHCGREKHRESYGASRAYAAAG